jgi:DNA primase
MKNVNEKTEKTRINLVDILMNDGLNPKQTAAREWHSPCPQCGGRDRFMVWPDESNSNGRYGGGRYHCRRCQISGDGINYLMTFNQKSYSAACKELGIDLDNPKFLPEIPFRPEQSEQWIARADSFLKYAQNQMTDEVRRFLHSRGLSDESIINGGLGWNEKTIFDRRDRWGLPERTNNKGRLKKVWIPSGLVIPYFNQSGSVIRIRIRRRQGNPRYIAIAGSDMKPMSWGLHRSIVAIVESELDGILLQQEAGDIAGMVALGSVSIKPDSILINQLLKVNRLLVCLDTDQAGAQAAWRYWINKFKNSERWPCVGGKDPGEMFKNGVSVRDWILAGVSLGCGSEPVPAFDRTQIVNTKTESVLNVKIQIKLKTAQDCGSCPAAAFWDYAGYKGKGLICFYDAYFRGKAGKPVPCSACVCPKKT